MFRQIRVCLYDQCSKPLYDWFFGCHILSFIFLFGTIIIEPQFASQHDGMTKGSDG